MGAHLEQLSWDGIGLTAIRLLVLISSVWAFRLCVHILRTSRRHAGDRRLNVVPTPVLYFTMFWTGVLGLISLDLILVGAEPVSAGWARALYGFSIGWSLFGLSWILRIGSRAANLGRVISEVKSITSEDDSE